MMLTREIFKFLKVSNINSINNISEVGRIENAFFVASVRTAKHWNPKYKFLRTKKFIYPKENELKYKEMTEEEKIAQMKRFGLSPPRYWKARPATITTTFEIMSPYEPPEGDGKETKLKGISSLSKFSPLKSVSTTMAVRKIRVYEPSFDAKIFPQQAHDIYVDAHNALMKGNIETLSKYVTEKALTEMMSCVKNQTMRWKFIESLEPPVVVQVKCGEVITKTNLFAQVTVRFHTKQSLALYDRFGRLYHGSEIIAKDVLEYVVFEKHINNEYGVWRLHGKIIPKSVSEPTPLRTYRITNEEDDSDKEDLANFMTSEKVKVKEIE